MENETNTISQASSEIIVVGILFLFIGFAFFMYIKTSRAKKKCKN